MFSLITDMSYVHMYTQERVLQNENGKKKEKGLLCT